MLPIAAVMPMGTSEAVRLVVTVTTAIVPLGITVALKPARTQTYEPAVSLHATDFPAALALGPATAVTAVRSVAGKTSAHCSAAGSAPVGEDSVRLSDVVPPWSVAADESVRALWPRA